MIKYKRSLLMIVILIGYLRNKMIIHNLVIRIGMIQMIIMKYKIISIIKKVIK
jgi:hypothetical protein